MQRSDEDDVDESYMHTPYLGTPPEDSPEDAFRNVHRQSGVRMQSNKGISHFYTDDDGNYAADADTSRDIEDFKKLYLK